MSKYTPDYYMILEFKTQKGTFYKVFGTWSGGYLDGDSWRLNSGITEIKVHANGIIDFFGASGSYYSVHKDCYGTTLYTGAILDDMVEKYNLSGKVEVKVLDKDTDWTSLDYSYK